MKKHDFALTKAEIATTSLATIAMTGKSYMAQAGRIGSTGRVANSHVLL